MSTYRKSEFATGQKADRALPAVLIEQGHSRLLQAKELPVIE